MFCKKCGKEIKNGSFCPMCGTENRSVNSPVFEKQKPETSAYDTYNNQTDYFSQTSQTAGSASRIDFRKNKWFLPSMLGVLVLILVGIVTAIVIICFGGSGGGSSSPEGAVNDAVNAIIESDYETLMEKCIPDDYFSGIEDTYGIDVKEFYNSLSGLYGTKKFNKNIDYSIKKVKQASSSEYKRFKKYFIYNEIPGMSLNTNKITDLFYITVEFVEYSSKGKVIDDETATLQVYKYDGKWYVYQLKEISVLE